ncbi:hypothetical protein Cni_G02944 [Canna indica]|uniref:Uncharacterized protein n=1 Tax=Canna indica TaxID=4628 RepID=A0AAQ3JQU3_9LILI|nr:hypothetical protein Cni_G02944 [Canna indica]
MCLLIGAGYNSIIPDAPGAESHKLTRDLGEKVGNLIDEYLDAMEKVKLKHGLKTAISISSEGNAYLQKDEDVEYFMVRFAGSQAERILKAEADAKKITDKLQSTKLSGRGYSSFCWKDGTQSQANTTAYRQQPNSNIPPLPRDANTTMSDASVLANLTPEELRRLINDLQTYNQREQHPTESEHSRSEHDEDSHLKRTWRPTSTFRDEVSHTHHQREKEGTRTTVVVPPFVVDSGPFAEHIMVVCLTYNCKLPTTLQSYDNMSDPTTHLTMLRSMMLLNDATDLILCRTFPTFLEKTALLWSSPKPSPTNLSSCRIYSKTEDSLHYIKQGQHEPLRVYLKRFNVVAIDIPNLNPHVKLYSVKHGLKPEQFADQIALSKLRSMAKSQERAKVPPNTEKSKRCAFHDTNGHTNEECVVLKDQIENLNGHDHRRQSRSRTPPGYTRGHRDNDRTNRPTNKIRRVIDHIADELTGGGDTCSARKRSLQAIMTVNDATRPLRPIIRVSVISFYEFDFEEIDKNMHDPAVISVINDNVIVRKVLVDHGSSIDILLHSIFKKMQLIEASLHPYNGDLVGFSGKWVNARGFVWLRMTFDSRSKAKTIDMQYLVIDIPSPYHMSIVRPSLNIPRVVVSTPHPMLKLPISETKEGVPHAEQKEARRCYNKSLKQKMTKPGEEPSAPPRQALSISITEQRPRTPKHRTPLQKGTLPPKVLNDPKHGLALCSPRAQLDAKHSVSIVATSGLNALNDLKRGIVLRSIRAQLDPKHGPQPQSSPPPGSTPQRPQAWSLHTLFVIELDLIPSAVLARPQLPPPPGSTPSMTPSVVLPYAPHELGLPPSVVLGLSRLHPRP